MAHGNYPVEVYRDGKYRVTFSPEEHAVLLKDGWTNDKPDNPCVVHTAVAAKPTPGASPKK